VQEHLERFITDLKQAELGLDPESLVDFQDALDNLLSAKSGTARKLADIITDFIRVRFLPWLRSTKSGELNRISSKNIIDFLRQIDAMVLHCLIMQEMKVVKTKGDDVSSLMQQTSDQFGIQFTDHETFELVADQLFPLLASYTWMEELIKSITEQLVNLVSNHYIGLHAALSSIVGHDAH
jgi:hypothetical protein